MGVQSAVGTNPYIYSVNTGFDRRNKRIVSVSELCAENNFQSVLDNKFIEVNGKMIDTDKLDRISPENAEWYTPKFSTNVKNGIRYMKSCFDFSNSGQYAKLTAAEDFTGMSDAEVYKAIYEKYQYCYGKDFYFGSAISYPIPPSEYDDYNKIIRRFEKEVGAALGDENEVRSARREALYGNMNDYEVRQAIIDEYDLSDGLTFRELYRMTYEIWEVGLDGGLHNRLDDLFYDFSTVESRKNCDNVAEREKYLDTKVSGKYLSELQKFYDNAMFRGNGILPAYSATLNQIRTACNTNSGGVSISSVLNSKKNNLQWLKL